MSLVSVIIPAYNRASLIAASIESVLSQGSLVHELIVIDDGSTDETREVISRYGPPVRYLNQKNQGPSAARNLGLRQATGEFVAFQDSDDLWPARKLDRQVAFLRANPGIDFVFGDMANFSNDPQRENLPEIRNPGLHAYLSQHSTDLKELLRWLVIENVVPTPTVVARREALRRVGYFDEGLRLAEDLDYWLRSLEHCRWGFINAVLLHRRRHATNLVSDVIRRNSAVITVLERAASRAPTRLLCPPAIFAAKIGALRYDLGSHQLRAGAFREAREQFAGIPARHPLGRRARIKFHVAGLLALTRRLGRAA